MSCRGRERVSVLAWPAFRLGLEFFDGVGALSRSMQEIHARRELLGRPAVRAGTLVQAVGCRAAGLVVGPVGVWLHGGVGVPAVVQL